jgi:ubiquinone/menaquinone biosynthesis C-methylase UbiE
MGLDDKYTQLYDSLYAQVKKQNIGTLKDDGERFYYSYMRTKYVANFKDDNKIISIGCGPGGDMSNLGVKKYVGMDISKNAIESAKLSFPESTFVVGDITKKTKFKDSEFDVCFMLETIEHLEYAKEALEEVYRILKPKGKIFITTPNRWRWIVFPIKYLIPTGLKLFLVKLFFSKDNYKVQKFSADISKKLKVKQHVHEFSSKELSKLMENVGFNVIDVKKGDSVLKKYIKLPIKLLDKFPLGMESILIVAEK